MMSVIKKIMEVMVVMPSNISVNLEMWNEVTNRTKSDVSDIRRKAPLDLLSNNIADVFQVQQLLNEINNVTDRYKEVVTRDIARMQEAGTRTQQTDSYMATDFAEAII